jgi:hypothetical protein
MLARPDQLDEREDNPGPDDRELDMDWEPMARDNDSSSSSSESESEEDRPQRQVVGRRHQAQAPRAPPPLRHQRLRSPFEGPPAGRQLIQVVIPPIEVVAPGEETPPREVVAPGHGEDVDDQLEHQIIQEQAAAIVGEQDYRTANAAGHGPYDQAGPGCACLCGSSRYVPDLPHRSTPCPHPSASQGSDLVFFSCFFFFFSLFLFCCGGVTSAGLLLVQQLKRCAYKSRNSGNQRSLLDISR